MTAAEVPDADDTVHPTRLDELHALFDEFQEEHPAANCAAMTVPACPPSK